MIEPSRFSPPVSSSPTLALVPVGAVERLPHHRRIVGVDADAVDPALELQADRAASAPPR